MKKKIVYTVCAIIILVTIAGIASIMKDMKLDPVSTDGSQSAPAPAADGELSLVENDLIKASYVEVFESPSVTGVFYVRLRVENKSDTEIWVSLTDASVNGVSTTAMSGAPMTIAAGKSSKNPFIFTYSNLDITQLSQLSDISFKFSIANNADMSIMEETDSITIPFES